MSSFKNSPSLSQQNIKIITRLRGPQTSEPKEFQRLQSQKIKSPKQNNKYQKYILEIGKNNFFPSPSEEQNRKKITEARIQVQKNKNLKKDMLNRYSKPVNKINLT